MPRDWCRLWIRRWHKWSGLTWRRRFLWLEAFLSLAAARIAVSRIPFRRIAPGLGRRMAESPETTSTNQQARVAAIGWSLRSAARVAPWHSTCLVQALAGKWMLRRRRLASTLYLGVDRGVENWLDAHAWLRYGSQILTGGGNLSRFRVIASFAEDWL
jgi:hypothetical protein